MNNSKKYYFQIKPLVLNSSTKAAAHPVSTSQRFHQMYTEKLLRKRQSTQTGKSKPKQD